MCKIVNGNEIATLVKSKLIFKIRDFEKKGIKLCLAVVVVGSNAASKIYISKKEKLCNELKIKLIKIELNENVSQIKLNEIIKNLNRDKHINGILVQLPLPKHLNSLEISNLISDEKDVDGFCYNNLGRIFSGQFNFVPCTSAAIMEILKFEQVDVSSKHCVVIGKSNLVGKPIAMMLLNKNATVTVCGSKTQNLDSFTKTADVIISATGVANLVCGSMVKQNVIAIDVGISRLNNKICGDINFDEVKQKAKLITPVPGGVGPVTVAKLIENLVFAAEKQFKFF